MALLLTFLDQGVEVECEVYTRAGVERFMRVYGTTCLVGVKGTLPFLPQRNVGATVDWLDRMGGTCEFDLDEVEALRDLPSFGW